MTSQLSDFLDKRAHLSPVDRMAHLARPYVAFGTLNTAWKCLDRDAKSILDVGCGKGDPVRFINRNKTYYTVGLDIFKPYLEMCRRYGTHDDYVLCDIKNLPIKNGSFDVALCVEVLEHLDRKDGPLFIKSLEKVARKQVIITTPVGNYRQFAFDENPFQEHKYVWQPKELKNLGYNVKGAGIRSIGGERGLVSRFPNSFYIFFVMTYVLMGLVAHFYTDMAGHMICFKNLQRA